MSQPMITKAIEDKIYMELLSENISLKINLGYFVSAKYNVDASVINSEDLSE